MDSLFAILFLVCLIGIIVGLIKPKVVIRWGESDKKNRKSVLKNYGIGAIVFLILCGVTAKDTKENVSENTTKPVVTTQHTKEDNKKVASIFDNKVSALGAVDSLTLNKESDVKEVRKQYDLLTLEQKGLVTKGNILISAENKINELKTEAEKLAYDTGITYDQLARTPDNFENHKVKFSGRVIQVIEEQGETNLRIAVNDDPNKVLLVGYDPSITSTRILENDYVEIKGVSKGLYTYESTLGGNITVPLVHVDKIVIRN